MVPENQIQYQKLLSTSSWILEGIINVIGSHPTIINIMY